MFFLCNGKMGVSNEHKKKKQNTNLTTDEPIECGTPIPAEISRLGKLPKHTKTKNSKLILLF